MTIFGGIVTTHDVEQAVSNTVALWIDAYLTEVESQKGVTHGTISRPRSYNATYDYENWPEGQLPGIAVVCAGTTGAVERQTGGGIGAWFEVAVDALVTGQTESETRTVAAYYQAALAFLLEQQGALRAGATQPFAVETTFVGYELRLPDTDNRTLAVGTATVRVFVDDIMNVLAGPIGPLVPSPMPSDWPIVETVNTVFTAEH